MSLALVGGSIFIISLSMQLPPDAPVSNKAFIVVVPISIFAEQRNSGRVYPELFFPAAPPWLAPPASENPGGSKSILLAALPHIPWDSADTRDALPKNYRVGMCFGWHQPRDVMAQNVADYSDRSMAQMDVVLHQHVPCFVAEL